MKIKSLEINNFKLFDRKFDKVNNISKADIVLLNGPNGYGKTSIFDAIEFALTGKIKRINKYSDELGVKKTEAYDKKILIADETKESYIRLCLQDMNCEMEMQITYNPQKLNSNNKASKENNPYKIFEKFERKLIVDGQEIIETDKQNQILKEYQLDQICEIFDKCCFISQDEHLGFLKEANKEKATKLEFLFEIPLEQQKELERVDKLINQLKNKNTKNDLGYLTKVENEKIELKDEIKSLNEVIENVDKQKEIKMSYKNLFPGKSIYWDAERMDLDGKKYDEAMEAIEKLIFFSKYQEICLNYLINKPYKDIIKAFNGSESIIYESNILEYTYRYYPLVKDEKIIEEKYSTQQKYEILKENIYKREFQKINWNFVADENLLDKNAVSMIKEKMEQVIRIERMQGVVSKAVTSITDTRMSLIKKYNDAIEQDLMEDNTCPLCGASYMNKRELDEKIKTETDVLQALCDDSSKEIKEIKDGIYTTYFSILLVDIENKLKDMVSESIYKKLQEVKKNKSNINNTKNLLKKISIELPEIYQEDVAEVDRGYQSLIQNIKEKLRAVPEEIESQLISKDFDHEYERYYDKNEIKFRNITSEELCLKENYVKSSFYIASIKTLNEKIRDLKIRTDRLEELTRMYDGLCKYQEAMQKGIREYKKKIIHDIEPLLYVYTAKILQQKFNGKSIFISTDEDMKNIQFINSVDDNQDILYNMSSGQLATVSLSFLLCMNQVYTDKVLPILLIDDPIQTIDDVNMVGLVDILRYEFDDRQIFISTHEQKFEWFLKYKYEKAEKEIKSFNMKNLLLQVDNQ